MPDQWLALKSTIPVPEQRNRLHTAHERFLSAGKTVAGVRSFVLDSWQKSMNSELDPEGLPRIDPLSQDVLRTQRNNHPLHPVMGTIDQLLVSPAREAGFLVAVSDADGRLLWVKGNQHVRSSAEGMGFVPGSDWSERSVGLNALGTALKLRRGVQIIGPEHYNTRVHGWSCTAVPVTDPMTGHQLGVIDITGNDDVLGPHALSLVQATVAALQSELKLRSMTQFLSEGTTHAHRHGANQSTDPKLLILGMERPTLEYNGIRIKLSLRHAEILTLLNWHSEGLSAECLAEMLYGRPEATVTLRAEMVRLRSLLRSVSERLTPLSQPYRLPKSFQSDAGNVLRLLDRGATKQALNRYPGEVLPRSMSPGIEELRMELAASLKESILSSGSPQLIYNFANSSAGKNDPEVWQACLRVLPARSPKRSHALSRLEML